MASLQSFLFAAAGIGIALVLLSVVLSVGADILDNVQDSQTAGSYAYNATDQGLQGLDKFASNQSTLAIVAVAAILIGVLFVAFPRM